MWMKKLFVARIQPDEVGEESCCCGREIKDVVGEGFGFGEDLGARRVDGGLILCGAS